ncbi:alcohol dehydrogenase catalytic domain-containing protein [Glutamicibacter sp. TV12E]|uniref:alcohol dehydrogenase catalytic domain-containing protein n=1 Tax=Glutamicibacter sp. TV12E TaxID=3446362 RepID=UPI004034E7B3
MPDKGPYKAIVRHSGSSTIVEKQYPIIEPGDLVLAPESVSLCGTDHQMLRGIRNDPSPILGHEGACRIIDGANEVNGFTLGQRVTLNPTNPNDPSFLLGHNIDGLFQQRVVIPRRAVESGMVVPIEDELSSDIATLIEPLAVVDYALACLQLSKAEQLVIIGDGLIGNLAACRASMSDRWSHVVLVHSTEQGKKWSENTWDGTKVQSFSTDEFNNSLADEPIGCLIATHRDRTPESIDLIAKAAGVHLLAVHVIGGVAPQDQSRHFPGVDLTGIRAANTGGPWPPNRTIHESENAKVAFTGNRGVTSNALAQAATDLTGIIPDVAPLISHSLDLQPAVELMNHMVATQSRHIDSRPIMRLVISMNPEMTSK